MPPGSKKRKAAKKKKESSLEKPSLDTHVDDSSATALPSPGSVDKEGSDSGSDIASPRTAEAPEAKVEEKEGFSSSGSTGMDTSENGAEAAEAEEVPAPVQTEEVADTPPVEDPKVAEAYVTPPDSMSDVPVSYDGGVIVEHVGDVPPAEEPEVGEGYLTPPDSSFVVPISSDGGVTVEHVEAADASQAGDSAPAADEPQVVTEIPKEVPPGENLDATPVSTETSREVLREQLEAAAAAAEPAEPPVPVSEEPTAPPSDSVVVERVEPSSSVEPTSGVKESAPITSAAYLAQPPAGTEPQAHTQESRSLGSEAVLPPPAARRASWWNCCGLCDLFAGNR